MPQAERIDRYEILRKIATGGMAELFLAKQTGMEGFEKAVVIKRILSHLAQDQEFVSMFLDEARIAAKLSHPNVVQIYDLGRADDTFYIAMEYVSGRNMAAVLRKARDTGIGLPIEHTARVVASVCDGLFYAHTRKDYDGTPLNIIHRDISPQNILVSFSGNVKLVDFGIAKASTQIAQTRAGVLKGKYAYMSPEQVRGDKIDARSDIFAVGIVMYEFLTGQRPFERETSLKTLKAIVQEKPLNPRELNPDVPIDVVRILSRALEKNPDRRYPNAQEMQLAVEDFLDRAPRKSNNVRLSRYLYELFDDELNADGGTMIVKGIGELIVPTGASSEAGVEHKVEELPEGTVRAALQEIAAAHQQREKDSVSIVTDEKSAPATPTSPPPEPAAAAPASKTPPPVAVRRVGASVEGDADDDVDTTTAGVTAAPAPPATRMAGEGRTPGGDATADAAPTPAAAADDGADDDDDDDDEQFPDTVMQAAPAGPDPADPASAPRTDPGNDAAEEEFAAPQRTVELERRDFAAEAVRTTGDPAAAARAAQQAEADAAGEAVETAGGDDADDDDDEDEDELDGATTPAYDLAAFEADRGDGEETAATDIPDDDGAAADSSVPFPPPGADEGFPIPDEAETASLSPDQVRRILDRVESLRQQVSGAEEAGPAAAPRTVGVRAAPTSRPAANDYESEETVGFEQEAALDYGADLGQATRAQPEPPPHMDRGNGHGHDASPMDGPVRTDPEQRAVDTAVDDDEPEVASLDLAPPGGSALPVAGMQESGGIRIVRRRASDAELRERAAFESGGPIGPATGGTPRPARPPIAAAPEPDVEPPDISDERTRLPPQAVAEQSVTAPGNGSAEVSQVTVHAASNARLLLVLAVLAAIAAGLGLLYLLLFATPTSTAGTGVAGDVGTVYLKTDPPGATIILDTRPHPSKTPTTIGGLSFNQQHLVVFKLEGYEDVEHRFTLTAEQKIKPIAIQLKKRAKK